MQVEGGAPPRVGAFQYRPFVYSLMAVYAIASIALMATHRVGITSEHAILIGIVLLSAVMPARSLVWDWLPFLFVAVMFEDLGAVSAGITGSVHVAGPIALERSMLHGEVATTWLQSQLMGVPAIQLVNVTLVFEYLLHFAAPLAAGGALWWFCRSRFGAFVTAYTLLVSVGFLIYLVFPQAPPWLASQEGLLPGVHRIAVETLQGLGGFGQFYAGADPEPNAAMPSLHVALPVLIAATVAGIRGWHSRTSWLLMLYPLTVAFGVVYLGEHYIADVVVGVGVAILCYGAAEAIRLRSWRRLRPLVPRRAAVAALGPRLISALSSLPAAYVPMPTVVPGPQRSPAMAGEVPAAAAVDPEPPQRRYAVRAGPVDVEAKLAS